MLLQKYNKRVIFPSACAPIPFRLPCAAMTYEQLIKHYGTQKTATAAIGRSQVRASFWKKNGIPIEIQCMYEVVTKGLLKADRSALRELKS